MADDDLLDFEEDESGDWILGESGGNGADVARVYPPGYCIEYAEQAYKLCLLGATDEVLADFFKVEVKEYTQWRNQVPEFAKAIIDGKDIADANVAKALYQRATGYSCNEDKVVSYMGDATIVRTKKHFAPDTPAIMFWLGTRQRDLWGKNALGHGDEGQGFVNIVYPEGFEEEDDTD